MVSKEDIQKEHIYLKETIRFHNNKYHSEDNPEISDQEFDQLFKQLKEFEKKYNFLSELSSDSNAFELCWSNKTIRIITFNFPDK